MRSGSRRWLIGVSLFSVIIAAVLATGIRSSRAQSGGQQPDYSKVNDFLNGGKHLLRDDDLIISLAQYTGFGFDGSAPAYHGGLFSAASSNSNLGLQPIPGIPANTPGCVAPCRFYYHPYFNTNNGPLGVTDGPSMGQAAGRFFNTDRDTSTQFPFQADGNQAPLLVSLTGGANAALSWSTAQNINFIIGAGNFISGVGDFNGDGYDDLLMGYSNPAAPKMRIATAVNVNNPQAGFNFGPEFAIGNPDGIREMTVGDFNGDGLPEIAELYITADTSLYLATYSVDPKTLTISNGGQLLLNKAADVGYHPLTVTAGRFTAATHQQLIVGSQLQNGGNLIVQSIDFDGTTIVPKLITTWNAPDAGSGLTFKLKASRFNWSSPTDQLTWLSSSTRGGTTLRVMTVDPASLTVTAQSLSSPIPNNCLLSYTGSSQMDCAVLSPSNPNDPWLSEVHYMRGLFISSAGAQGQGPQLSQITAGNKLILQTRVYNYSLKPMDNGTTVHVRFYGQPMNGTSVGGDSFQIGNDVILSPIPAFNAAPNAPLNWVLATSDPFDTTPYAGKDLTFWVIVWMQKQDGTLAQEIQGHGLNGVPGALKSFSDATGFEEAFKNSDGASISYSNNIGFYNSIFHVLSPNSSPSSLRASGAPELKIDQVQVSSTSTDPGRPVVVSATLKTGVQSASNTTLYFYDGDTKAGGKLIDMERIPFINANSQFQARVVFRSSACGSHRIFVVAAEGRLNEASGQSQPIQVECPTPVCVSQVCMRSAQYYSQNLNHLPRGSVSIGNMQISTNDTARLRIALQGGNAAPQYFTQQVVATQLNLLGQPGQDRTALMSNLLCYRINFQPVQLSTGVTLNPGMTIGELLDQARIAARRGGAIDLRTLANVMHLLNGDDPTGRCR